MRNFTPRYDHDLANELLRAGHRLSAITKNLPQWRRELNGHRQGKRSSAKWAKKKAAAEPGRAAREEAELQAAATVRSCINALQLQIDAINSNPPPVTAYHAHVNLRALINIVFALRHKCGVTDTGGGGPDDVRVRLDPSTTPLGGRLASIPRNTTHPSQRSGEDD